MIGNSKNSTENCPRKCFWTQEKETWVKFKRGLSANRPSNYRALDAKDFNLECIRWRPQGAVRHTSAEGRTARETKLKSENAHDEKPLASSALVFRLCWGILRLKLNTIIKKCLAFWGLFLPLMCGSQEDFKYLNQNQQSLAHTFWTLLSS